MLAAPAFTIDVISRLTGFSEARLRRWDTTGFFTPSYALRDRRKPHSRIFSLEDLIALQVIGRLLESGVPHRRLKTIVPWIKDVPADSWDERRLYVSRGQVFFDFEDAVRAADGDISHVVTIDMRSLVADIEKQIQRLSERTPDEIGRVSRNRWIMSGEPVLAGTRIPTATVYAAVRHGDTPLKIVTRYPRLTEEDVAAAVAFEEQRRNHDGALKRAAS
jgi:uncharacterized protein (DUF433 family)